MLFYDSKIEKWLFDFHSEIYVLKASNYDNAIIEAEQLKKEIEEID